MISVLMPTWNRSEYLAEAIESVIAQTEKDWELVIVDNASTDSSDKLFEYYIKKDKRIKIFGSGQNYGISSARNYAFEQSTGDFIAVMDSDDIMAPDRLKKSLKALKDNDLVYSSFLAADSNGKAFSYTEPPAKLTIEGILDKQEVPHVTLFGKQYCFRECPYREEFKVNDDQGLIYDMFRRGYKFKKIREPLMIVRYHDKSTSKTRDVEVRKVQSILRKEAGLDEITS
jgi:glycosyltransferase involved in cell wall biosynthesis